MIYRILNAILAEKYTTPAKRIHYSVLDKTKIKKIGDKVPYWRDTLEKILLVS